MSLVPQVELLQQRGRFLEALSTLESGVTPRDQRLAIEISRSEIYERLGRYRRAGRFPNNFLHVQI